MLDYDIAFLKGDQARMEQAVLHGLGQDPSGKIGCPTKRRSALAYSGRLQQARSMSRRAVDQAQQAAQRERAGLWEAGAAVREAFFGNSAEARTKAIAALDLSKDREVEYGAAFALTLSGDFSRAQAFADDLERRFPEDTSIRFSYLPALHARVALSHGDASKAIEMLQVAVPHELGAPRSSINALFGALYPIYVRGEAYLAAHQGTEAAAEFQKILDHRGIVVSDPIGALARLQLGRAFAMSGDKDKAKAAYQDFLTLWKHADPDIPILRQAKMKTASCEEKAARPQQRWRIRRVAASGDAELKRRYREDGLDIMSVVFRKFRRWWHDEEAPRPPEPEYSLRGWEARLRYRWDGDDPCRSPVRKDRTN